MDARTNKLKFDILSTQLKNEELMGKLLAAKLTTQASKQRYYDSSRSAAGSPVNGPGRGVGSRSSRKLPYKNKVAYAVYVQEFIAKKKEMLKKEGIEDSSYGMIEASQEICASQAWTALTDEQKLPYVLAAKAENEKARAEWLLSLEKNGNDQEASAAVAASRSRNRRQVRALPSSGSGPAPSASRRNARKMPLLMEKEDDFSEENVDDFVSNDEDEDEEGQEMDDREHYPDGGDNEEGASSGTEEGLEQDPDMEDAIRREVEAELAAERDKESKPVSKPRATVRSESARPPTSSSSSRKETATHKESGIKVEKFADHHSASNLESVVKKEAQRRKSQSNPGSLRA